MSLGIFGVLLISWVGGTPETTDFDLYHPYRHFYLVKNTLLGGGNFANKLKPGLIYVWDGINRGSERLNWYKDNPWTGLGGFYKHKYDVLNNGKWNDKEKSEYGKTEFGDLGEIRLPDPCKWLLHFSMEGSKYSGYEGGNVPRYLASLYGETPNFGVPPFDVATSPNVDCTWDKTRGGAVEYNGDKIAKIGSTDFSKTYYGVPDDVSNYYLDKRWYLPTMQSAKGYKVAVLRKHPVSMTFPSKYFMSVVKRFIDPSKHPCPYPHLCSADEPYLHGTSLFQYWLGGRDEVQGMQLIFNFDHKTDPWMFFNTIWQNLRYAGRWPLDWVPTGKDPEKMRKGLQDPPYNPGAAGMWENIPGNIRLKTPLLGPVLNMPDNQDQNLKAEVHPAVQSWEPRNQKIATGDRNIYLRNQIVNQAFYPVNHQPWMERFKQLFGLLVKNDGPLNLSMNQRFTTPMTASDAFFIRTHCIYGDGCAGKSTGKDYLAKYKKEGKFNQASHNKASRGWTRWRPLPESIRGANYLGSHQGNPGSDVVLTGKYEERLKPENYARMFPGKYNVRQKDVEDKLEWNNIRINDGMVTKSYADAYGGQPATGLNFGKVKHLKKKTGPYVGGRRGRGVSPNIGMYDIPYMLANKIEGNREWVARTERGQKFTYAYSAGCWTKLNPADYGFDIPSSKWEDEDVLKLVNEEQLQAIKDDQATRTNGTFKWQNNEALNKWWQGSYGEQNFFSLRDAIRQNRCNGDEMLWYLFYSKPSRMDEFCHNTIFGNKIPKDFCKENPPAYWNFTVTEKNIRLKMAERDADTTEAENFRECLKELRNWERSPDVVPHTNRMPLPEQLNRCLRTKTMVRPKTGMNAGNEVTHLDRFGDKWMFTGFSQWNAPWRKSTEFYKSSSQNENNPGYIAWKAAQIFIDT